MTKKQELEEEWSAKYKKSINCNNPKGFSQRAHCQGRKKMSETIDEGKNKPTNPGLWSRAKSAARSKFKVYPSAYANAWASKWYKKHGGGWRKAGKKKKVNEDVGVFTDVDALIFKFSKDPKIAAFAERMNPIDNPTLYRDTVKKFTDAVNKYIATQDKISLDIANELAPQILLASPQSVEAAMQDIIKNSKSKTSTLQEAVSSNLSTTKLALFLALTLAGEGIQIAQQNSQLFSPEAQKVLKNADLPEDPEKEEYDQDTPEKDKSGGGSGGGSKPPSNFRVADKQPSDPSPKPSPKPSPDDYSRLTPAVKRAISRRRGRSIAKSLGLFESKLLCECSCGCDECGMTADDYLEIDGGMMGSDPYAFDEEFDEYEGNTEDFMNQSKGDPDLNSDGIYDQDELYYHFDLDDNGQVTPDEYESHVEYHAEHPEILNMKKKEVRPMIIRMLESKWR